MGLVSVFYSILFISPLGCAYLGRHYMAIEEIGVAECVCVCVCVLACILQNNYSHNNDL